MTGTPWIVSHVDLRVRDRAEAIAFYDAFLPVLGVHREYEGEWVSYARKDRSLQWFAFVEDRDAVPNTNRIAFAAPSRDAVDRAASAAQAAGARNYEGPHVAFGNSYSAFFEDPTGNALEICCAAFS